MNNTLWILLGVAVVAAGVVLWLLLAPPGGAQEPALADVTTSEPTSVATDAATVVPEESTTDASAGLTQSPSAAVAEATTTAPLSSWAVDGVVDLAEYRNQTTISDVVVYWQNDANTLRMALESPGTGYISIGLDPGDRMEGANFIIGYVQEGVAFLRDDYGTDPTMHTDDTERGGANNILSSAGAEWADHTLIEFVIPLDSGDAMDKALRPGGTYEVLVAYHDLQDGFSVRHSRRGAGEITLDSVP